MPYGTSLKDAQGIPIAQVYIPGIGFQALQGVAGIADASNNTSAGVASVTVGPTGLVATVNPAGELRVAQEQTQVFYDPFDTGALDTVVNWKTPVASGGGVAAAVTSGLLNIGSGTTASGYSVLESGASFRPPAPGWLLLSLAIKIEQPVTANAYRFWGVGTHPSTPTTALPLTDAIGYEMSTTGVLSAVIWAGGTRIPIQDFSVATGSGKQPLDGQFHAYGLYLRADKYYWVIDGLDKVVATTNFFQTPNVQTLPVKFVSIAAATPPTSSAVITCPGVVLSDTARNTHQIADGVYPWRKATVDSVGGQRTAGCSSTAIAAGATGPTVIKSSAGTLYGVLLTSGPVAGIPTAFDNASAASGKIVLLGVTSAAAATMYTLPGNGVNCTNGITFLGGASMPAITVFWS